MCGWVSSFVVCVCVCVCYACTSLCVVCVMHDKFVCYACTSLCVCAFPVIQLSGNSHIYSCTRLSAVVTLTRRKAEYTTDVWSLWKIAHGKMVSVCVLKGSGPLSHPLSLPFPLQVW